jgi:hypothetical protein
LLSYRPSPAPIFQFSQRKLTGVHPDLYELQRQAARLVFARLGIEYIPNRLEQLLHRCDFGFALFDFARQLGGRLDVLLDIYDSTHKDSKDNFSHRVDFVRRVEQEAKTTNPDPNPLFEALSGQLETAETLFGLYKRASALCQLLEKTNVVFPMYHSFRKELLESMKDWHQMPLNDAEEADKILQDFIEIQRMFGEVTKDIDAMSAWINRRINKLGEHSHVPSQITDEIKIRKENIRSGRDRPDEGTAKLYELRDKLKVIANELGYVDEELRAKYSALLSVSVEATREEIRSAYRRLAHEFHPDHNRDDPLANEKFEQIDEAYRWLNAHSPV